MTDDIFNENKEFNIKNILLTIFFFGLIIVAGLYFTGKLPGFAPSGGEQTGGQGSGGSVTIGEEGNPITEEPINESEKQDLEQTINKVILIKYTTFKTDDGAVLGVTGYLGIKVKYYDNILNDIIFSVQNVPAKELRITKEVYKKDYNGYVVIYFKILPVRSDNIDAKKLDLLVLYLNVPSKFTIDLSENVKVIEGDFNVELQYSIPKISENPVNIVITFNVFSKYKSKVNSVINDIMMHYQESNIVMNGEEQYYMQAFDYSMGDNSISISYRSSPNVQSGVYSLIYNYYLNDKINSQNLGKILVKNSATIPSFLDFKLVSEGGKVIIAKDGSGYKLILEVKNIQNMMSLPLFRVKIYDYNLNLVKEVNLDGQLLGFGKNIIEIQIPDSVVSNKGIYYLVFRLMTPDESLYSLVLTLDSSNTVIPENEQMNLADIKFMVYPTQFYTTTEDNVYTSFMGTGNVTLYAPLVIMYPSSENSINVTVTDMFGKQYSVKLQKVIDYRVSSTSIVPVYTGMFRLDNVPLTQNFIITIKLPDSSEVKGSLNLVNIYYNGGYLNDLFNTEIVKSANSSDTYYNCDELRAFYIVATSMGLSTPETLSESINGILSSKLLLDKNDVQIDNGKIVLKVVGGASEHIMQSNWVSYIPSIQGSVKDIKLIIRQNENPVFKISIPTRATYSDGKIIIDAPFIDSQKYVYIEFNNYIIPLNWFRSKPDIQTSGFDYSIYTYFDPKFKIESIDDLSNLYYSVFNDNPLASVVLSEKLTYTLQLASVLLNQPYGNENETQVYNNTTYTNITGWIAPTGESVGEEGSVDFFVGSDEPVNSASLVVNGISIPANVSSIPQTDYYVIKVSASMNDIIKAVSGVTLSDILSGKRIIELKVGDKVYYNLEPSFLGISNFMVSGDLVFALLRTPGDTSVLKCNGVSLNVIYDVTIDNQEGVVFHNVGDCDLFLQTDLFGEVKITS